MEDSYREQVLTVLHMLYPYPVSDVFKVLLLLVEKDCEKVQNVTTTTLILYFWLFILSYILQFIWNEDLIL